MPRPLLLAEVFRFPFLKGSEPTIDLAFLAHLDLQASGGSYRAWALPFKKVSLFSG